MRITVFTPTYNRAYIIENLYRSLQFQTCKDFEWLVVDDGSTDETSELFKCWCDEEKDFSIRYYRKENGGKCSAINYGLNLAHGNLFFTVDSDDYLTGDAIEKVLLWESELPQDTQWCGLAGNLGTSPNITPNSIFTAPFFDGSALDRYRNIDGERAMVFYTEIHRRYLYPLFDGEKFMTEAVAWNRMAADGYRMRFFNDIIWIYQYREDGLTKSGNQLFHDNPNGYGLWLREKTNLMKESKLKMYYTFCCDMCDSYTNAQIAEFIGAPRILVSALCKLHNIRAFCRK